MKNTVSTFNKKKEGGKRKGSGCPQTPLGQHLTSRTIVAH